MVVLLAVVEVLDQNPRRIRFERLRVRLGLLAAQRVARARERKLAAIEQPRDQHRGERDGQQRDQQRDAALVLRHAHHRDAPLPPCGAGELP